MLDLCHHAYLYAQALDNQGDPEYWQAGHAGAALDRLALGDERLPLIRRLIDDLASIGRRWSIGTGRLDCRVNCKGECVITIHPVTRDVDGRISPVLVLFNALGPRRLQAVTALSELEGHMGRSLSSVDRAEIEQLKKLLLRPRICLAFHIMFTSRRSKK